MTLTKHVRLFSIFLGLFFLLASSAFAAKRGRPAPPQDHFYLAPTLGGYILTGSDRHESAPLLGAKLGYEITGSSMSNSLAVEGTVNFFPTKSTQNDSKENGWMIRIDAVYPFILKSKYTPYLVLGIGERLVTSPEGSKASPLLNYGAGVRYSIKHNISLRFDARQLFVYEDVGTLNNFETSIGFNYYFGKEKPKPAPPPKVQKAKEKVKEPVTGRKEPYTKIVTLEGTVDAKANPDLAFLKRVPTPEAAIVLDAGSMVIISSTGMLFSPAPAPAADLDMAREAGVLENLELYTKVIDIESTVEVTRSAAEPAAGLPTPDAGKVILTPGSMVIVSPGTELLSVPVPPAEMVAAQEAGLLEPPAIVVGKQKVIRQVTVEFDSAKADIHPKYHKQLREIAEILKGSPGSTAIIEGHTDIVGKKSYNVNLSQRRADNVREFLVKSGAERARIATAGFWFFRPIADNSTEAGRARNRRAETRVAIVVDIVDGSVQDPPSAAAPASAPASADSPQPARGETGKKVLREKRKTKGGKQPRL